MDKLRIGVLASGGGSNLKAIIDACDSGMIDGDVAVVISDKKDAYALQRAKDRKIPAFFAEPASDNLAEFNGLLLNILLDHKVDLVCMAGYMRLLGGAVLDAYPMAVMNIHPSILPAFKGATAIKDALEGGVKVTGVTVHFANSQFDKGPIILQRAVSISEEDNLDSLVEKIHKVEHEIYPEAIGLYAKGKLKLEGRKVKIIPSGEKIEI